MKPIEETHPSLSGKRNQLTIQGDLLSEEFNREYKHNKYEDTYYEEEDIQKHTIDKAVLKKLIFDESLFPCYDKHYRNHLCKKLGLEE